MDVRAHPCQLSDESLLTRVLLQPNYVQSLHNLLTQSTSNDTATLKAVRLIVRVKAGLRFSPSRLGHRGAQPRVLYLSRVHTGTLSDNC